MRVVLALAALALLAGCDQIGGKPDQGTRQDSVDISSPDAAAAFAGSGNSQFDYRYAYRLPGNRVKAVLQSNADACDRLGPARCRILAMRYRVDDGNRIRAVLTFKVDPSIARAYGDAVTKSVTGADGVLVDTEVAGAETTAAARSVALVSRLRDQLQNAQNAAQGNTPDALAARNRAQRLQIALDTIAEVEAGQGQTLATAPVLITYESSTALTGLGSADANFRNAGQTLETSVASLVTVLASVGPWLIVVLLLILVLRWIVHGRAIPEARETAPVEDHPHESRHEDRNLIHRWFSRDEEPAEQH